MYFSILVNDLNLNKWKLETSLIHKTKTKNRSSQIIHIHIQSLFSLQENLNGFENNGKFNTASFFRETFH